LSEKRFVEIGKFRGKTLVSIREFYTSDDGELLPGKKGISLSLDQWKKLVESTEKINDMINESN
jgi:Transcriptional Coactivator p15 (PC4)